MINLKTNKNLKEILEYKKYLNTLTNNKVEMVVFPSTPFLGFFYNANYKVGSQNLSIYETGSHTGEILAKDLKSLKVSYCLLNHAEREDSIDNIKIKIKNATKEKMKAILCFGEKKEKNIDKTIEELIFFLNNILSPLTHEEQENILLAYEPIYLIGKSETLAPEKITKICIKIKEHIKNNCNLEIPFLYGGGVNPKNCKILAKIDKLDGFLIGNSANNPENIRQILVNL